MATPTSEQQGNIGRGLRRSDSLTKQDKQAANARKKEEEARERSVAAATATATVTTPSRDNRFAVPGATMKMLKTLANQRRIRRRHTVGGTKDFAGWERVLKKKTKGDVDLSLRDALATIATACGSSPNLVPPVSSLVSDDPASRRLSLPDTVMAEAANAANVQLPALLESQV